MSLQPQAWKAFKVGINQLAKPLQVRKGACPRSLDPPESPTLLSPVAITVGGAINSLRPKLAAHLLPIFPGHGIDRRQLFAGNR
jgi:hypothetical protein